MIAKKPLPQRVRDSIYFVYYNWMKRSQYRKENANESNYGAIVFFGDSITDICDLNRYYPEYKTLNRGISGNTTRDLLKRIDVSVFDAKPSKVMLLIGVNDMMNEGKSPDNVAVNYEKLVKQIRERLPEIELICQSVYPGWDGDIEKTEMGMVFPIAHLADDIVSLNKKIADICERYHATYVDMHSILKESDNTLITTYSYDGVHPNEAGYDVITTELKKYL